MIRRIKPIILALLFLLQALPGQAQTRIGVNDDLAAAVRAAGAKAEIILEGSRYNQPIEVIDKQLTITGAADGTLLDNVAANSIIYIDATSVLTMERVNLTGANAKQAVVHLNGGTFVLSNATITGPFRFGIYATAGSKLTLENVTFEAGENGVYVLDQAEVDIRQSGFVGVTATAITAIGAQVAMKINGVDIKGPADTGIMIREGAFITLSSSAVTNVNNTAIYMDNQANLIADDVIIDTVTTGILAFGIENLSIKNSEISNYQQTGIAVKGAKEVSIYSLHSQGAGTAISMTDNIAKIAIDTAVLDNNQPKASTILLAQSGASHVNNVTTSGGYAGIYIQGPRSGPTYISNSDFHGGTFASGIIQSASASDPTFVPTIEDSQFFASGEAVAIALDNTPLVRFKNLQLVATENPALSFNESAEINFENTIVATGSQQWAFGDAQHNFEQPSKANILATDVDFSTRSITEVLTALMADQSAALNAATGLGRVMAGNNTGLPLFGNAARVLLTDTDGQIYEVSAKGVELEAPSGIYTLSVDDIAQGTVTVTANALTSIEIPDPAHPYFFFQQDDKLFRGNALPLRKHDVLLRNYKARGVNTDAYDFWNKDSFGVARAGLTQDQRTEILAQARELYFTYLIKAHNGYINNNLTDEDKISGHIANYSSGVIAALGTVADRDRILDMLPDKPSYPRTTAIEVAGIIEARLGLTRNSALMRKALELRDQNILLSVDLATVAGAIGQKSGITLILDLLGDTSVTTKIFSDFSHRLAHTLLARSSDPRVLAHFRGILREYNAMIDKRISEDAKQDYFSTSGFNYYNLPVIMEYVAVYGNAEDAKLLAIPVAGNITLDSALAGIVRAPMPLYFDYIGLTSRPLPLKLSHYYLPNFGKYICRGLERRPKKQRESILETYKTITGPHLNDAIYGGVYAQRTAIVGEAVTQVTSAYCNPNIRLAGAYRRDQDVLEVFFQGNTSLSWGNREIKARQEIEKFNPSANWADLRLLSNMSVEAIETLTSEDPRFETVAGLALLLNHRALDHKYIEPTQDIYQGGSDRRLFLTALASSNGEAIVTGRVDLRPIISGSSLKVGIRLRIAYEEKGFLTPQMSGRDVAMENALNDAARGLIKAVHLRKGPKVMPMHFESSSQSGVHIFSVDMENLGTDDLAELIVDVDLEVVEEKWPMHFPLFIGDFAFRYRSDLP